MFLTKKKFKAEVEKLRKEVKDSISIYDSEIESLIDGLLLERKKVDFLVSTPPKYKKGESVKKSGERFVVHQVKMSQTLHPKGTTEFCYIYNLGTGSDAWYKEDEI
jgi:hypothetical protein